MDLNISYTEIWRNSISYLGHILETDVYFHVKCENEYSKLKRISAGVSQGSGLRPILYQLYTKDLPNRGEVTVATFADDTAILTAGDEVEPAANHRIMRMDQAVENQT